jgi:hypothetical protein
MLVFSRWPRGAVLEPWLPRFAGDRLRCSWWRLLRPAVPRVGDLTLAVPWNRQNVTLRGLRRHSAEAAREPSARGTRIFGTDFVHAEPLLHGSTNDRGPRMPVSAGRLTWAFSFDPQKFQPEFGDVVSGATHGSHEYEYERYETERLVPSGAKLVTSADIPLPTRRLLDWPSPVCVLRPRRAEPNSYWCFLFCGFRSF